MCESWTVTVHVDCKIRMYWVLEVWFKGDFDVETWQKWRKNQDQPMFLPNTGRM